MASQSGDIEDPGRYYDSELELSDDADVSDISDDSGSEYEPETESEDNGDEADLSTSGTLSGDSNGGEASPRRAASFRLVSDPFSDTRPSSLPNIVDDFEDVHPEILAHHSQHPMTAFDCVKLFLSAHIFSLLCEWTNARAAYFFRDNPSKNIKNFMGRKWEDVSVGEMYIFFCLQLLMGITKLPRISDYWSNSLLCRGPPVFRCVMSRNRFSQILKFIRFSHPDDVVPRQPMKRLHTFFDMLRENCMNCFSAGENFAVDESLILFKGRLHFRQYIKTKRKRFGLKLFALCPSSQAGRGYTWSFCLYTPQLYGEMITEDPALLELSKSERVPVFLMKSLLNKGRHVVLDNWYSSLRLAEFLLTKNTLTTATIRPNRGVPQCVKAQSVQPGQTVFARKSDVLVVKYCDNNPVHVITTKYNAGFVERNRHLKGGRRQMIMKPLPVQRYNEQMGSVDVVDQLVEPYDPTRKSYAWFKKLGLHMMLRMVLNAAVVYQCLYNYEKRTEFSEFIKQVVDEILYEYSLPYVALNTVENEPKPPKRKRKKPSTAAAEPLHSHEQGPDPQPGTSHEPEPDPQPGTSREPASAPLPGPSHEFGPTSQPGSSYPVHGLPKRSAESARERVKRSG